MGLGKLNIWIHDDVDPCRISDLTWFVNVTYCNGGAVKWCDKNYVNIPAKCGHADVDLPPGCYVVFAGRWVPGAGPLPFFFRLTHSSFVMVECDEVGCAHLYTPTLRHSTWHASSAAQGLAQERAIPPEKAQQLVEAASAVSEHLPKTAQDAAFEQLMEELKRTGVKIE